MGDLTTPTRIDRSLLERERIETLRRGGWKPGLWLARHDDRLLLVKDVRDSNGFYRWMFGRWILWHEARMYARLSGSGVAPDFAGSIDRDAFAVAHIDAITLGKFKKPAITPEFYDRLQQRVDQLHALKVVHLDLRSRRNVLVTRDGEPLLVDFGNALYFGRSRIARRLLMPLLARIDDSAVVKFRGRDFPETLTSRQRAWFQAFRIGHVIWPWGRLWRAMGVNRWMKQPSPPAAEPPSATEVSGHAPLIAPPLQPGQPST